MPDLHRQEQQRQLLAKQQRQTRQHQSIIALPSQLALMLLQLLPLYLAIQAPAARLLLQPIALLSRLREMQMTHTPLIDALHSQGTLMRSTKDSSSLP
jgi:hypothetical protein